MVYAIITSLNYDFLVPVVKILLQIRDEMIKLPRKLALFYFFLSIALFKEYDVTILVHSKSVVALRV